MKTVTRIVCLVLCLLMLVPMFAACSKDSSYGAQINMYLADEVYNFDPALAHNDKSASKLVSLMFEGLVSLDDDGDLKKQLLDDYTYEEDFGVLENDPSDDTFTMIITLKPSAWSDKTPVSADDFAYAWRRILSPEFDCEVASLLFDIKGAMEHKTKGESANDVEIYPDGDRLTIGFAHSIDPEAFLRKIANVAFVPVRNVADTYYDWASSGTTIQCNGPFVLRDYIPGVGMKLTRNPFYRRDVVDEDSEPSPTKYVKPYCINIDFQLNAEDMMQMYEEGQLFYISELPMDKETKEMYKKKAEIFDTLSTHSYIFNLEREPFNNKTVRQVLGQVIDRSAIASELVFAYAATGYVPKGVADNSGDFASNNQTKIGSLTVDEARDILRDAGITPSSYGQLTIAVKVDSVSELNMNGDYILSSTDFDYDVADYVVATMVAETWNELGFNFKVVPINAENYKAEAGMSQYRDAQSHLMYGINEGSEIDMYDKNENIIGQITGERSNFDVIAVDNVLMYSDAFYALAPYARLFSGTKMLGDFEDDIIAGHISGFKNEQYEALISEAYAAKLAGNNALASEKLHAAEAILIDEMPVVPIFVYQEAVLIHKDLSKVKFDFYGNPIFSKVTLKNWKDHLPSTEEDD